jgi:hypothetical protein
MADVTVHLTALYVAQTVQHQMVGLLVTNELAGTRKEVSGENLSHCHVED